MGDISSSSKPTIYFGFGSNLWRHQMVMRCPTSKYLGIGRLKNFKWIINSRGYANVVQVSHADLSAAASDHKPSSYANEVWGLIYSLQPDDEEGLDINEGVPFAYTKEWMEVDFWATGEEGKKPDMVEKAESVKMLVYIDRERVVDDQPKKEYVYRMNMGIKDAVAEGMPGGYVEDVLRRFVPDLEDEGVKEEAGRQAVEFEDER